MKYVMIAITLCILKALETRKNIDKQQTVSILVYSNLTVKHGQSHFASIIYRKGGKKTISYRLHSRNVKCTCAVLAQWEISLRD